LELLLLPCSAPHCWAAASLLSKSRSRINWSERGCFPRSPIAYYGVYVVNEADKTLAVKIEQSTYTNVMGGPEQKRIITSLTADEMKFTNPRTPAGVTLLTAWKRAAAR